MAGKKGRSGRRPKYEQNTEPITIRMTPFLGLWIKQHRHLLEVLVRSPQFIIRAIGLDGKVIVDKERGGSEKTD